MARFRGSPPRLRVRALLPAVRSARARARGAEAAAAGDGADVPAQLRSDRVRAVRESGPRAGRALAARREARYRPPGLVRRRRGGGHRSLERDRRSATGARPRRCPLRRIGAEHAARREPPAPLSIPRRERRRSLARDDLAVLRRRADHGVVVPRQLRRRARPHARQRGDARSPLRDSGYLEQRGEPRATLRARLRDAGAPVRHHRLPRQQSLPQLLQRSHFDELRRGRPHLHASPEDEASRHRGRHRQLRRERDARGHRVDLPHRRRHALRDGRSHGHARGAPRSGSAFRSSTTGRTRRSRTTRR